MSRNVSFSKKKNIFIQQETMSKVVGEILDTFESSNLNLSSKLIAPVDLSTIVSFYEGQDLLSSMY
jgi:hypothetical protein